MTSFTGSDVILFRIRSTKLHGKDVMGVEVGRDPLPPSSCNSVHYGKPTSPTFLNTNKRSTRSEDVESLEPNKSGTYLYEEE